MKTITATNEKIADVYEWGTETNGSPRKINRGLFKTNDPKFVEVYTSPSKDTGIYETAAKSEIISVDEAMIRFANQGLKI